MSEQYAKLIAAWQAAEKAAQDAEDKVDAAFTRYLERQGPPPTDEQRLELRRLRKISRDRLADALEYLKQAR